MTSPTFPPPRSGIGSRRRAARMRQIGAACFAGAVLALLAVISTPRSKPELRSTPAVAVTEGSQAAMVRAVREVAPSVVSIQVFPAKAKEDEGARPTGSGVIIDSDGHILTTARVIEGGGRIRVTISGGKLFDAKIVGRSVQRNVAVLKIAGHGLPEAAFGRSRSVPIGTWLVALGRAADGQGTASVGVLSARDRRIPKRDGGFYMDLLQTDAAINPVNSGGPLVDLNGEVVGISTAEVPSAYAQGIGFAVASEIADRVARDFIRYGRLRLAWLGIQYADLNPENRQRLGLGEAKGAVVMKVFAGTPAERAGLRTDDVIVAFDKSPLESQSDLRWHIIQARPRQKITLKVWRKGRLLSLSATLTEMTEE